MFSADALRGKRILITGGGTGLGKSMGERFLELGAGVTIVSRREQVLAETAAAWRQRFGDELVDWHVCDVRDPASVEECVAAIWERGGITGLLNNAAGNFVARTETLSPRAVDAVLSVVLHGTAYMTLAVGKRWISEKKPGHIVNIVTTYASTGSAYVVPSAMGKAGVLALTRSLAVEWGPAGIRSNAIAPGVFPTPEVMARLVPTPELRRAMTERCPLGRAGEHGELANLAAFLFSDLAPFLNGECITIDGGEWVAGAGQFNFLRHMSPSQWEEFQKYRKNTPSE